MIDGSWKGRLLVRDRLNGEIVWEESVADARITTLTCTRDRRIWAYTRETGKSVAILKREWPFWKHHAATVTAARDVKALTVTDDGRRLAAKTGASLLTFEFGRDSHPARLLRSVNDLLTPGHTTPWRGARTDARSPTQATSSRKSSTNHSSRSTPSRCHTHPMSTSRPPGRCSHSATGVEAWSPRGHRTDNPGWSGAAAGRA